MKYRFGKTLLKVACISVMTSLAFTACDDSSSVAAPAETSSADEQTSESSSSEKVSSSSEKVKSSSSEKAKSSSSEKVSSSSEKVKSSSSEKVKSSSSVAESSSSVNVLGNACTMLLSTNEIFQHDDVLEGQPFVCEDNKPRLATLADTLKLDTVDICFGQRISEGDLVTGIYTNKTYTCENGLARKATKAEIELGHGCTENLTATGFVFQGKVCNEQGAWRDSTESEKIVGSLCVKPGTMTLGRKWSCDGEGKWTVISSDNVTSLGFIGKSVFVASYTARGTQLWTVRHLESMVLNFNDAKDYCSKLTWEKNGTKSAGFHLVTEDDWATLLRYNEYARYNGYGDSTNLYKYYLRGESFYDSEAEAGNKNCNTEERLGPDKRCASPTWVTMWTDDYSNGVTYTLYNTDEIKPTKAAVRSVDAYQQEPTTKQPFFCVNDSYRGNE